MGTKMKNPLTNVDKDIVSFRRLSIIEKIGLISTLIIAAGVLIISSYSFIIDIRNIYGLIADLIFIIMSASSLAFVYNLYKKKIVVETLIDTAFQKGVYNRLEPLIENIAQSHVDTDIILDRMSNIDLKVENILKEKKIEVERKEGYDLEKEFEKPVMVGTSLMFIVKSIFMMVITMAIFMFLVNFNLGNLSPIVSLLIFVLWWIFITNEYGLWKDNSAWLMVFIPTTIIPITVLVLGNILNYNVLMAVLYVLVGFYVLAYYIWAVYTTTGVFPFTKARKLETESDKLSEIQQKGIIKDFISEVRSRK